MKLLKRFVHLPSASTYDICVLECDDMKNQAFALLYRKYIAEAKVPWDFPTKNASNIRVEKRSVDGKAGVPVLVDDFEHTAVTLGIVSSTTGKVVGTSRILCKNEMLDGKLEVERYEMFPEKMRNALVEKKCRFEFNRLAVDDCLKGAGSSLLMLVSFCFDYMGDFLDSIMWTQTEHRQMIAGYSLLVAMKRLVELESFRYTEKDPKPVMALFAFKFVIILQGIFRALKSGTILIPSSSILSNPKSERNVNPKRWPMLASSYLLRGGK